MAINKFIDALGVELEGKWNDPNFVIAKKLVEDVSLDYHDFNNPFHDIMSPNGMQKRICLFGELVSKPMDNINDVMNFLGENWPNQVSFRCGYHFHISPINVGIYSHLMSHRFYDEFLKQMEKWGAKNCPTNEDFWRRFKGEVNHTSRNFRPDIQVKCRNKDEARQKHIRRTQINYPYRQYKTIEFRLLPMFVDYKLAQNATIFIVDLVASYLSGINVEAPFIREDEVLQDDDLMLEEISNVNESPNPDMGINVPLPYQLYKDIQTFDPNGVPINSNGEPIFAQPPVNTKQIVKEKKISLSPRPFNFFESRVNVPQHNGDKPTDDSRVFIPKNKPQKIIKRNKTSGKLAELATMKVPNASNVVNDGIAYSGIVMEPVKNIQSALVGEVLEYVSPYNNNTNTNTIEYLNWLEQNGIKGAIAQLRPKKI